MKPYVVKLGARWAWAWVWGCWDCDELHCGFTWRQAVACAVAHRWRHEVGFI